MTLEGRLIESLSGTLRENNKKLDILHAHSDVIGILLSNLVLQDAAIALDLLHLRGDAQRTFFHNAPSIAAAANTDVVDLDVPPGDWVGFWRNLEIEVNVSNAMTMVVFVDSREELRDDSLTNRDILPPTIWLPFFNNFRVNVTNDDVAAQTVKVSGFAVFLNSVAWRDIKQTLEAGIRVARDFVPHQHGEGTWA